MVKNNPTKPAMQSTLRRGTGGVGDPINPEAGTKDWAKISPRERDRIIQSMSEGFPPEYRLVLERVLPPAGRGKDRRDRTRRRCAGPCAGSQNRRQVSFRQHLKVPTPLLRFQARVSGGGIVSLRQFVCSEVAGTFRMPYRLTAHRACLC